MLAAILFLHFLFFKIIIYMGHEYFNIVFGPYFIYERRKIMNRQNHDCPHGDRMNVYTNDIRQPEIIQTTCCCGGCSSEKGATGPMGPTGPTGPMGRPGATGAVGATGPMGATGPVGAAGPMGVSGATGPTGATGLTGEIGATGPIGPAGTVGATGATGPTGLAGAVGATGATGPIGLTGAVGATGATGPIGLAGAVGATGATGPIGLAGAVGATGATGPIGLAGAVGATGATGPIGLTGAVGATGATGPIGPAGTSARTVELATPTAVPTGSYVGVGASSGDFSVNTFVVPENTTITGIALHTRDNALAGAQSVNAAVYSSPDGSAPTLTSAAVTVTAPNNFGSASVNVPVTAGSLISVRITSDETLQNGAAVTLTFQN